MSLDLKGLFIFPYIVRGFRSPYLVISGYVHYKANQMAQNTKQIINISVILRSSFMLLHLKELRFASIPAAGSLPDHSFSPGSVFRFASAALMTSLASSSQTVRSGPSVPYIVFSNEYVILAVFISLSFSMSSENVPSRL